MFSICGRAVTALTILLSISSTGASVVDVAAANLAKRDSYLEATEVLNTRTNTSTLFAELDTRDPTKDVTDFSWIKNWAAIGDSFTAGIGSGDLVTDNADDKSCSRYDYSYPTIMNRIFGPSVSKFTFTACTGATSQDVFGQANALPSGLDLVVLTLGGNDLCLVSSVSFS